VAVAISHTASFEYIAVDNDHSQAGVAVGTASADRLVFVMVSGLIGTTGHDINTMTIGGVSAARVRRDQFTYAGLGVFASFEVWWALVPTGTTATIAFVHDASYTNAKLSIYAVTGANTSTPISDHDFATRTDALTNALSVSVDVPANGGAIGLASGTIYQTSVTTAWTYLTEDLDNDFDVGSSLFVGFSTASAITSGAAAGQAVTATLTGTGSTFGDERGLTVVTIAAASATETAGSASGTGTATGTARSVATVSPSATGTGTAIGTARAVASSAAASAGSGDATAISAVIASAAGSASGAATAIADTDTQGFVAGAVTFPPVGGGGGFAPAYHGESQRFRTRKDKSKPKVITVRIGDWPEDPQIILERQEKSERDAFHRSLATRRDEPAPEPVDDEEQALMEILAFAA
jgi:hypothetical protein